MYLNVLDLEFVNKPSVHTYGTFGAITLLSLHKSSSWRL